MAQSLYPSGGRPPNTPSQTWGAKKAVVSWAVGPSLRLDRAFQTWMAVGPSLRLDRVSQTWGAPSFSPAFGERVGDANPSPKGVTIVAQHPLTPLRAGSALGKRVIKSPSPFRDGTSSPTTSKPVCRPAGLRPPTTPTQDLRPGPGAPGSPFCWANLGSVHSAPGKSRFGSCHPEPSSTQVSVQKTDANLGHRVRDDTVQ